MCSRGDAAAVSLGGACSRVIEVPQVEDCLQPVVNIVPLQVQSTYDIISMLIYKENISLCLPRCNIVLLVVLNAS